MDSATKLRAVAELDAGVDADALAARLHLHPDTLRKWKKLFDEGELLADGGDDAAEPEVEAAPAPAPASAAAPKQPRSDRLPDGTELPPLPVQREGAGRRSYDDDFRYQLGKIILARRTSISHLADHYQIARSMLRGWADAVSERKIKPSPKLRAAERAANGHAARPPQQQPPAAPATQQLTIEGISMPPSAQIVPYPPPSPAVHPELAELLLRVDRSETEAARLRLENERLRNQLRMAFDMVLSGASTPA